ncbi:MAG TPA: 30S ribosomal protein S8 [Candidatus Avalokitesvara rifleensis]|uniref:30S ribosomal protein S8 n=1 Tax=Candidatus Avalokitesvara rifleensis TaxID=3367620 RepID=UPI0027128800|nr:30S ribosomal protein S8 [Candidatus Brocadiales bacterium]
MTMTDPIADMLTRIRNANMRAKESVDVPRSNAKCEVARVLKAEGFIKDYKEIEDNRQGVIRVYLKYGNQKEKVIRQLKRESKPGRRLYTGVDDLGKVMGGVGVAIVSTPKGIMSDRECRKAKVGGEIICTVW